MTRREKLNDREYRASFAESFLDTSIATQIRVLREQRKWTQAQLAEAAGMRQSRISALEDANYSRWSIGTLKRLARAFDVPLNVDFGTYGQLLSTINGFGRKSLQRARFVDDPAFNKPEGQMESARVGSEASAIGTGQTGAHVLQFNTKRRRLIVTIDDAHTSVRDVRAKRFG